MRRQLSGTLRVPGASLLALVGVLLDATMAAPALAQAEPSPAGRCAQLVAYYDRYGGGSGNSDGRRNHTCIAASIDCRNDRFAEGIATIEKLLRDKKFTVQPPGPATLAHDN
ncbi:hypothetical protein [Reyranella sp.]|uniref:hypothetical protein n=1 Tax=Reyranella sp. TaxID=1929291 RepID=UPI003BA863EC